MTTPPNSTPIAGSPLSGTLGAPQHEATRRSFRRLLPCLLGLTVMAAMTAGPQVVDARGVTPLDGKAWVDAESSCFTSGWNMLENSCNATRKWLFGAPIDSSGNWHAIDVHGRGTGTSVVKCWVVSNTADGLGGWSVYGERSTATYGELAMNAPNVWIPLHGTLHVDCDLPAFTGGTKGGVSAFHYDL